VTGLPLMLFRYAALIVDKLLVQELLVEISGESTTTMCFAQFSARLRLITLGPLFPSANALESSLDRVSQFRAATGRASLL
jgi:hypothetical protein